MPGKLIVEVWARFVGLTVFVFILFSGSSILITAEAEQGAGTAAVSKQENSYVVIGETDFEGALTVSVVNDTQYKEKKKYHEASSSSGYANASGGRHPKTGEWTQSE